MIVEEERADVVVNFSNQREKLDFLKRAGGLQGLWRVVLSPRRKERSMSQNAYFHGPLIETFIKGAASHGQVLNEVEAKEILRAELMRTFYTDVDPKTGEETRRVRLRSTKEYDRKAFSELIDKSIAWILDRTGWLVPPPTHYGVKEYEGRYKENAA